MIGIHKADAPATESKPMATTETYQSASWAQDFLAVVHASLWVKYTLLLEPCIKHVHTVHFAPLQRKYSRTPL